MLTSLPFASITESTTGKILASTIISTTNGISNPFYTFQASGANVPGHGTRVKSRNQQWNPSHTWTISNSLVNEFRVTCAKVS